jgi:hypothetical protein
MKKEEREDFARRIFESMSVDNFSVEEKKIVKLLPFFKKEMAEVLNKVILIDTSFRLDCHFGIENNEKILRCFLIEVMHDTHSSLCIKYSKIFKDGKTLFLGFRGLDLILLNNSEKIENKKVFSFDGRKGTNKNYIPGIDKNQRILPKLDFIIRKGSFLIVFKE